MLLKSFKKANALIEVIESHHHEAYFVGGAVRDLLLDKKVNDIDITTSATPQQIQKMFNHVIPVGIEHGTVLVRYGGDSYEVTTFREDGLYSDQRHPDDVTFIRQIDADLKRRDFTINALAMDKHGTLIDLFDGQADLQNRLIRSVGQANERFMEDPLRIIRAIRFSSQLGFKIEDETSKSMISLKDELEKVAVERITVEMTKFFQGEFINQGMYYLKETNIYEHLPLIKHHQTIIEKLPKVLIPFESFGEVISLFHFIYPKLSINKWVNTWKGSNAMKKEADQLFQALKYYETAKCDSLLVFRLDRNYFSGFSRLTELLFPSRPVKVKQLNDLYESLPIKSRRDINFNGNDLLQLFPNKQKGQWISKIIEQIEKEIVLNNLLNKHHVIKEWVLCNPPEVS